ncbi:MAG: hypothetical protein FJ308_05750 [Planctomycetes bacterium]|nr:hypothetical protein [Planctomycetota bacterium]
MNSSTPSFLSTSQASASTSPSTPVLFPHVPKTGQHEANSEQNSRDLSIETRSILLGRALAQRSDPQHPIVSLWLESARQSLVVDRIVPPTLVEHIREIVFGGADVPGADRDVLRWCETSAMAMQWIADRTTHWPSPLRETALLKPLIPGYLATSQSSGLQTVHDKTACGHTNTLLSELMTIVEIEKSLSHCGFNEWFTDCKRFSQDPIDSMRQSFQIQLSDVTVAMCTRITQRADRKISALLRSIHAAGTIQEFMHRGWWSIALQWCSGQTAMTPPPELKIGLVPWDRLRAHWNQLLHLLDVPLHSSTCSELLNATTSDPVPLDPEPSNHRPGTKNALQLPTTPSCGDMVHDEVSHDEDSRRDTPPQQSSLVNLQHHKDSRLVEMRSANDPLLQENLGRLLDDCRMKQGILSIVVVRLHIDKGAGLPNPTGELHRWQSEYIRVLEPLTGPPSISGFLSENGDLALVIQDIERSEIVQIVRDGFAELNQSMVASRSLATKRPTPFVAGISTVSGPSRSFAITQLIDAAWRCLDGAIAQGGGSVKSLEVF